MDHLISMCQPPITQEHLDFVIALLFKLNGDVEAVAMELLRKIFVPHIFASVEMEPTSSLTHDIDMYSGNVAHLNDNLMHLIKDNDTEV